MANPIPIIENFKTGSTGIEVAFTAVVDTLITSFTATNNTGINRSYRGYIYASAGTPEAVRPLKFVTSNRGYDEGVPFLGKVVRAGGSIRLETPDAADTLVFNATGQPLE